MNAPCYQHPDQLATATCAECQRPICSQCAQTVAGRAVCASCVAAIRARVGNELNAQPPAASSSAIPVSVPKPAAGIPMNVPRPNSPPAPPAYGAGVPLNTGGAPTLD